MNAEPSAVVQSSPHTSSAVSPLDPLIASAFCSFAALDRGSRMCSKDSARTSWCPPSFSSSCSSSGSCSLTKLVFMPSTLPMSFILDAPHIRLSEARMAFMRSARAWSRRVFSSFRSNRW